MDMTDQAFLETHGEKTVEEFLVMLGENHANALKDRAEELAQDLRRKAELVKIEIGKERN